MSLVHIPRFLQLNRTYVAYKWDLLVGMSWRPAAFSACVPKSGIFQFRVCISRSTSVCVRRPTVVACAKCSAVTLTLSRFVPENNGVLCFIHCFRMLQFRVVRGFIPSTTINSYLESRKSFKLPAAHILHVASGISRPSSFHLIAPSLVPITDTMEDKKSFVWSWTGK